MSYRFADSLRAGSGRSSVLILLATCQQTCMTYTTAVCTVKTHDDGQRNYPKHVESYSKNKFEKSVHLVGFIIGIYHDARSTERQINVVRLHKPLVLHRYETHTQTRARVHTVLLASFFKSSIYWGVLWNLRLQEHQELKHNITTFIALHTFQGFYYLCYFVTQEQVFRLWPWVVWHRVVLCHHFVTTHCLQFVVSLLKIK